MSSSTTPLSSAAGPAELGRTPVALTIPDDGRGPVGSPGVSPPSLPPLRTAGDRAAISIRDAVIAWVAAYLVGAVLSSAVFAASGAERTADLGPGWLLFAASAQWAPMVAAIWFTGRRFGVGRLSPDFGLQFAPVDLIGVPIGVITQLVIVRLVYLPLESIWPETFRLDKIEERARNTYDSAQGGGLVLLVLVVAAPKAVKMKPNSHSTPP